MTNKPVVKLPTPDVPAETLDSSSDLGPLCTHCLSYYPRHDKDIKKTTQQAATYSNAGKTLEEINALRARNQENSVLLRLPTELLTMIWKMATESEKATRVHGMVSRQACTQCVLSLVHSCSLLHHALYPAFLGQDAFVVKVSSSDSLEAADELERWWTKFPHGFIAEEPTRPLIFMELRAGCLPCTEAVRLAAEVQLICSAERLFHPRVLVEMSGTAVRCYGGPRVLMKLHPPPVGGTYNLPAESKHFNVHGPSVADQHDLWKGWVATTVTEDTLDDSKMRHVLSMHEVLAVCRSYTTT